MPRYRDGQPDPKGAQTVQILATLNYEAITEGRCASRRNLERIIGAFLRDYPDAPTVPVAALSHLAQAVRDNDTHGLGQWFFLKDGQQQEPFRTLRGRYPDVWLRLRATVA